MSEDKRIYTEEFQVGWQDVDPEGKLKMKALTLWIQEVSWKHAALLGYGNDFMQQNHGIWVMFRLCISMFRYPRWDDTIRLITWPRGLKGIFAQRDFEFRNTDHELLAAAASEWLVLGREDRKPMKSDMLLPFLPHTLQGKAAEVDRLVAPIGSEEVLLGNHKVEYAEIDMNQHANTSSYLDWTLNHVPQIVNGHKEVKSISITFLSECKLGDEIQLKGAMNQEPYTVKGIRTSDNKPVYVAVFRMS